MSTTLQRPPQSVRVAPRRGTRMIRVTFIVSGHRRRFEEVSAGTTAAEVAQRIGVTIEGNSFRAGSEALDPDVPLETDTVVLVAPDITAG